MKLRNIVPEADQILGQQLFLSEKIAQFDFLSKAAGSGQSRSPNFGIDFVVNQWVREQSAFRKGMILDIIALVHNVAELRGPITTVVSEVFRRGFDIVPAFECKCMKCGKKFEEKQTECPSCGSDDLKEPDESQLAKFKGNLEDCNAYDQSLEDVLRQVGFDLNTVDNGYLLVAKQYKLDGDDNRIISKPTEIRRIHPALIEIDVDREGIPKKSHWFCFVHRKDSSGRSIIHTQPGICPECKMPLEPAMYKMEHLGTNLFFSGSEICSIIKFSPNELYGYPPVLTVFEKTLALTGMDKTLFRHFFERKTPPAILMVHTDDVEGLRREKLNAQRMAKENPDDIPWVGVSARQGTRGRTEYVKLMPTLAEYEFSQQKTDIRERIAAMWGVSPIWQGSLEASGGISSQTQQLVVTSRALERDQRIFNEKVFPFIFKAFGITDWKVVLNQPEEKAEQTKLVFMQQRIQAAQMLNQMGFDVELLSDKDTIDDVQFKVSGKATKPQAFGGFGGGVPGMPPGGAEGTDEGNEAFNPDAGEEDKEPNPFLEGKGGDKDDKEEPLFPVEKSAKTWIGQIHKSGYSIDDFLDLEITNHGAVNFWFMCGGESYLAKFSPLGKLRGIHPRPMKIKTPKSGVTQKIIDETHTFVADGTEEEDDDVES